MILALFQPDIPQNTGSLIRLAACMSAPLHVIEPCGFAWDDRRLRRSHMDYYDHAQITRHLSWESFLDFRQRHDAGRLVLMSAHAASPYTAFTFRPDDMLLLGRESAGVPDYVRESADARIKIPMREGTRSLNVALAASMVLGEAIRQTR